MRRPKNIMVTGGAGFIGSNFIRYLFEKVKFDGKIVNVDKLTYAGNLENLADIHKRLSGERYFFEKCDICDSEAISNIIARYDIDTIVNFAAESHVDRSIHGPGEFITTNIVGTFSLLDTARRAWQGRNDVIFHQISTDEVFGSLGANGYFVETTPYSPRSPYSASKASANHLVEAYFHTYGFPVTISNCSNNYGPYQFPEKLIPLIIANLKDGKPLPVYGTGDNIRDWLHVDDHNSAVWAILTDGKLGEQYNIGGDNEWKNLDLIYLLCEKMAAIEGKDAGTYKKQITFVKDRLGHDKRYAIDCSKIKNELGWKQSVNFKDGIEATIKWYLANSTWINNVRDGNYTKWLQTNY